MKFKRKLISEIVRKVIQEKNLDKMPVNLSQYAKNPEQAKRLATTGDDDGNLEDDKITSVPNPAVAPVTNLKPSQTSMNIPKAMGMALSMISGKMGSDGPIADPMNTGGDLGAFISSDNFIMDGHHRWIATGMVDPSKSVGGYSVAMPGTELIKILNAITVGRLGIKKGKSGTGGFEQFKADPIKKELQKLLAKGGYKVDAEGVQKILEFFTGVEGDAALDAAVNKFVTNLGELNFELPNKAPERPDMPVIDDEWAGFAKDSGKAAKIANAALTQGEVDWNDPPFDGEEEEEEEEENKAAATRRESLLHRWAKLIK